MEQTVTNQPQTNPSDNFDTWLQDKVKEPQADNFDEWLQSKTANDTINTTITNKVAMKGEPDDTYIGNVTNFFKDLAYQSDELKANVYKGIVKGVVTNPLKFVADVTGHPDMKEYLNDANGTLDKYIKSTSKISEIGETVGQVVGAVEATGGFALASIPARISQGFAVDLLAFDEKSGNIADVFDKYDIHLGGIIDTLKSNDSDTAVEARLRNAFANLPVAGAMEAIVGGLVYGRGLVKDKNIELSGTDAENMSTIMSTLKEEGNTLSQNVKQIPIEEQPVITKAQINEGQALYDRATEMIKDVPDNYDELLAKGITTIKTDKPLVDATVNLKQPLNAEKITPTNANTLAQATQGIEADASFISHQDLLKKADSDLKTKLGQDGYELVNDLTATASNVENLSLKVTQARVVVGNLAQKYQEALIVAQKEGGAESTMRAMLALDNLVSTSKILKNTTSTIAKAMSAMRINTEDSHLFNSLKIMDNIDTDYSMSLLRDAMSKGDNEAVMKLMDNFSDTTKKLKDHVDDYKEGFYTKLTNVLSETVVAGMLSAPSTLAMNVIGGTYLKHQKMMEETLQYAIGRFSKNADRMKDREFRYLMSTHIGSNFNDIKLVGRNLIAWGKSGFKDEVMDEAILARFIQDQEFGHIYTSSQYIRGIEVGNQASLFNTSINTFGKLARSPYKIIGAIDDYYKRGAFRSELSRVGNRLADARNVPDSDYIKFMDKFIKVNTELHLLRNNGHKPTTAFLKQNKDYIGTGDGLFKYADEARDHANYMTFQSELKGSKLINAVGKGVNFLNSDGLLRILVPFKLSPINMLRRSISDATVPISPSIYKDIFVTGGLKKDIALSKLAYSSSVLFGIGALVTSGNMTGTFSKEERQAMSSAGIPELSYRVGDKWFEYKQLEPLATIAGVITDVYRIQQNFWARKDDIDFKDLEAIEDEANRVLSEVGMSIVNNIVSKTYAKSLSDTLDVVNGNQSKVNYLGNLASSIVPMSSLANFIGREFGDGYRKEASTFSEKLLSKYRGTLDRDALDAYGRPIKEVQYSPFLTKESEANNPNNKGALEVARLGINLQKMDDTVSYQGIKVKLKPEEYWQMRRNLDTKFGLSDKLNTIVSSDGYKAQSDYVKSQMLSNVISQIKLGASQSILTDTRVTNKLQEGASKLVKQSKETAPRPTYNTMILGEGK